MTMWISHLWRYPVKSMAGESLLRAQMGPGGIVGDRTAIVVSGNRIITSRTHPRLLGHKGTLDAEGEPLVDGKRWDSPEVTEIVRRAAGNEARIIRYTGVERFDVLPLLVATDGSISAFGYDSRRLRPNLVVAGVEGLAERLWEGKSLRAGEAIIHMRDLRQRCVMTTFDPDTQQQDMAVLRKIVREFANSLCLNSSVIQGGVVSIGDEVDLIEAKSLVSKV